ncbi:helix-turn-helix domain-containing protein [Streptomyces sp. I5]|uniref:helix-turn-helix domain-containing protein n=1 Tax=Streptomyces sp. I5 TaxID=2759947 RepID=UPI0018EEAA78|nr:helix-turn-helix domain-containing protein [Streptomyces sp. I5]MBJ6633834.1 helix-turn-helix transcriptional regulator [Streptomyces sp. I5]
MAERRSIAGRRAVERFFSSYEISDFGLEALASMCRIHTRSDSHDRTLLVPGGIRRARALFVQWGCVQTNAHGSTRLWKGKVFFFRATGRSYMPEIYSRGSFRAFSVPESFLREIVQRDASVGAALLQLSLKQQQIADDVYGVRADPPLVRVATLLEYLAQDRSVPVWDVDTGAVVGQRTKHVVDGPTQTDLAEALGLGRATVEKALAQLRKAGALAAPDRRRNRYYEIADTDLLKLISLGVEP